MEIKHNCKRKVHGTDIYNISCTNYYLFLKIACLQKILKYNAAENPFKTFFKNPEKHMVDYLKNQFIRNFRPLILQIEEYC